jgi:hypothetical protein
MSFLGLCNEKVNIKRPVQEKVTGTLRPVMNETSLFENVNVRFSPLSGKYGESVLGRFPTATNLLFLPPAATVKENDVIVRISESNKEFLIKDVRTFWGHHIEAVIEEKR